MGNGASKCKWRHAPEARGGFWDLPREKTVGFRLLAETFVVGATRARSRFVCGGADENDRIERMCTSLRRTFKFKGFVPKLRSRKCFSWFLCCMLYIYEHNMSISHIAVSGYGIIKLLYIYIVIHWQCFVVSQLFSVARHAGRFKLVSNRSAISRTHDRSRIITHLY